MSDSDPGIQPAQDLTDVAAELAELDMTEAELEAALEADGRLPDLATIWEPDDRMIDRVTNRVERRIADREALTAVLELGGLGWFTLRALFGEHDEQPIDHNRPDDEENHDGREP